MEQTLLSLDIQLVLKQLLQHLSEVLDVYLERTREDEAIQVHKDKLVYHVSQYIVDQGLENRWAIGQPKWHDLILKVPLGSVEGRLPLIRPL